eukprot:1299827-Rhodomonas_salina.2
MSGKAPLLSDSAQDAMGINYIPAPGKSMANAPSTGGARSAAALLPWALLSLTFHYPSEPP